MKIRRRTWPQHQRLSWMVTMSPGLARGSPRLKPGVASALAGMAMAMGERSSSELLTGRRRWRANQIFEFDVESMGQSDGRIWAD